MPKYRVGFTRDAFIRGTTVVEAATAEAAAEWAASTCGHSGVDDDLNVEWDLTPHLLDNVDVDQISNL